MILFEVETIPLGYLYSIYAIPGLIGLLVGIVRWWAGAIWFFGPTLFAVLVWGSVQYDDVSYFYAQGHIELDYVIHNLIAPVVGIATNAAGILIGLNRKRTLESEVNLHADATNAGRI